MTRHLLLAIALMLLSTQPALAEPLAETQRETVADSLEHPWSLAFLPDGRTLITERAGRLRVIEDGELLQDPVAGVPETYVRNQGGLFEVLAHPDWEDNGWIYISFAHGDDRANTTRVVRGRLDGHRLIDVEPVFTATPTRDTPVHFGGRMAFLPDNTLLIGLGDGFDYREDAQRLDSHTGTVVRITDDGDIPGDNPFADAPDALPEIFSYGHRNVQGIVHDREQDVIWSHEHGPRGGDELNRLSPGSNYGWPVATHGRDYSGARITPHRSLPGKEDPLHVWTPAIAPAGMSQYRGDLFPELAGDLLIAGLVARSVVRVHLDGTTVADTSRLFDDLDRRVRDVRVGPEGALYLLTDHADGELIRITPAGD
ncbi:PQQ-dependent sugar dehydrogenase [Aquisalimonas sp. 2447]|uniref:PQQ-dependent sugar dehydrogenase n=1 Tax=Aquisalimonas sp. 2447 TaxID=2740807 RepID=UPI001432480A|nr:PQQ-dependent sugar dehydrogenase [Aquisalimonas sp. 2447]QIT56230.1 PQQ-dependent sugar dehydrogenase [Aquisalimonas sp. 2447]